jgi:hypothetical protein
MKYYITLKSQKTEFDNLPKNTYFATGFGEDTVKGDAYHYGFIKGKGTCLVPIFESETDLIFNDASKSGETIEEGTMLILN